MKIDAYAQTVQALSARTNGDWRRSEECIGLATHCAACGHQMVDALSVQLGMGPDCRHRVGYNPERAPQNPDWEAAKTVASNNGVNDNAVDDWSDVRAVCNFFVHVYALAAEQNPWIPDAVYALGFQALAELLAVRREFFVKRAAKRDEVARARAAKREEAAKARARRNGRVFTDRVENVVIEEVGDDLLVRAPYNEGFNAALRSVPGRRWDSAAKAWRVPAAARPALWTALRGAFAGLSLVSAKGTTVIPAA